MDKPSSEKSKTEPKVERCSSKRSVEYESFNKMIIKREREKERERERERKRKRKRERDDRSIYPLSYYCDGGSRKTSCDDLADKRRQRGTSSTRHTSRELF